MVEIFRQAETRPSSERIPRILSEPSRTKAPPNEGTHLSGDPCAESGLTLSVLTDGVRFRESVLALAKIAIDSVRSERATVEER